MPILRTWEGRIWIYKWYFETLHNWRSTCFLLFFNYFSIGWYRIIHFDPKLMRLMTKPNFLMLLMRQYIYLSFLKQFLLMHSYDNNHFKSSNKVRVGWELSRISRMRKSYFEWWRATIYFRIFYNIIINSQTIYQFT